MGMYDYFEEDQIKIFYRPIFDLNEENPKESSFWHSMGQLRYFHKGENLPLKELWYQYPENFFVYDYRLDYDTIWVVKDGKYDRKLSYKELPEESIIPTVYDYHGTPLNIQKSSDFQEIKNDVNKMKEEKKKIETSYFPNGAIYTIRNDLPYYESKQEEYYEKMSEAQEIFSKKWINEQDVKESHFGAYLDCYLFARNQKQPELEAVKIMLQKMMYEVPDIVEKYKTWVNDKELLEEVKFDELIQSLE